MTLIKISRHATQQEDAHSLHLLFHLESNDRRAQKLLRDPRQGWSLRTSSLDGRVQGAERRNFYPSSARQIFPPTRNRAFGNTSALEKTPRPCNPSTLPDLPRRPLFEMAETHLTSNVSQDLVWEITRTIQCYLVASISN